MKWLTEGFKNPEKNIVVANLNAKPNANVSISKEQLSDMLDDFRSRVETNYLKGINSNRGKFEYRQWEKSESELDDYKEYLIQQIIIAKGGVK